MIIVRQLSAQLFNFIYGGQCFSTAHRFDQEAIIPITPELTNASVDGHFRRFLPIAINTDIGPDTSPPFERPSPV